MVLVWQALLLIESDLKEELQSSASELINTELALTLDQFESFSGDRR